MLLFLRMQLSVSLFLWVRLWPQFNSVTQLCPSLCDPMDCRMPGSPVHHSWSLLRLMSIELLMPSNCLPLLLLPSIFPSIRVFSNESTLCTRWPKYWSFSLNISPSNEYSELISFRINWLDLLAVQRTVKSLLQHHSSKASVLQRSASLCSTSDNCVRLLERL